MCIDPQMKYCLHKMTMHLFSNTLYLITTTKKSDSLRFRRLYHAMYDKLSYKTELSRKKHGQRKLLSYTLK